MPVLTTKAIYSKGVVIPQVKPSFGIPDEVVVTFVKYQPAEAVKVDEDPDEVLFRKIEPKYRRIRGEVVKEHFPKFYEKYILNSICKCNPCG